MKAAKPKMMKKEMPKKMENPKAGMKRAEPMKKKDGKKSCGY